MKRIIIGFLLFFFCASSYAYYSVDLTTEDSLASDLGLTDFSRADFISFSESDNGESLVRLKYKDNNVSHNGRESLIYKAKMISTTGGPRLFFLSEERCREGSSHNTVIVINDQNVSAESICEMDAEGSINNAYFMPTEAGESYAVREFKDNNHVRVRFKDRVIPFDVTGFITAWGTAGEPVL